MDIQQYEGIEEALDAAESSVTPFPVVSDDEIAVVGDANATQLNKHNFKVGFRVPVQQEDGSVKYVRREKEFKDVYITPRDDATIARMISALLPMFKKIRDDGGLEAYTKDEQLDILRRFDGEILDRVYDTVAAVLHISDDLKPFMYPMDAIDAATQILTVFPEAVNEADTFFG